jgi:2-polyprenyl-3-methyl-5-hydroxy-6-metoxy-1,4-benzoquinol methylase
MRPVKTQEVACPLCAAAVPVSSHFKNGADRIRRCPECSVGFVYPRLSGSELLSQYSPKYFEEKYDKTQESEYVNVHSWRAKIAMCLRRVNRLRRARAGLLLDVGCGRGWFLDAARERGWQVQGLELCAEVAQSTMERVRTQVYIGSIFDIEVELPSETFDLVTMFDVIEHLEAPLAALRICHRILKPGGALAISTPNLRGLGCRLLGAKAFAVWPDEHIFYFGPTSMKRALQLADFTDMEIASREIYPENAATMLSGLLGRSLLGTIGHTGVTNDGNPEVRSVKRLFRNNPALKGVRAALNSLFAALPIGDELLAFTIKR